MRYVCFVQSTYQDINMQMMEYSFKKPISIIDYRIVKIKEAYESPIPQWQNAHI